MEVDRIIQSFDGKTILITGCTGFLAKILVEKILRVLPNVKKLFLLIRSSNGRSAKDRLHQEIIDTELFKVLRKKWGENINCILSEKLIPISGDVSHVNLGITNKELINEMCGEIDFIINSAATTRFDERYDVAMDINAFGPLNVLNFAKRCSKLKLLLHVSTAYVHGSRLGILKEEAIEMGTTLEGAKASCLDIEEEMKLIEEAKKQLHAQNVNLNEFTSTLRDLGTQRANFHGWPNTYSYTKAIGEMNLGYFNNSNNIHVIIIRPSIISSTLKDPFPGWMEGLRTLDAIAIPYAKRKLNFIVCDPNVTIDVVPGDMVVNSMLAAMAANAQNECNKLSIYNVGTSLRNPIKLKQINLFAYEYFKENPLPHSRWKLTTIQQLTTFTSMATFHRYIRIHYLPFLTILKVLNVIFCNYFQSSYTAQMRRINQAIRLAELYKPYLLSQRIFDDANTQNLRNAAAASNMGDVDVFNFDPKSINWEEYFINIHFPGIVKYVLKL